MSTIKLTATQQAVLEHGIRETAGKIDWFPENIKGGARKKVLDALENRALITTDGADWFVAAEGYDALGCKRPAPVVAVDGSEIEASVAAAEAQWAGEANADVTPASEAVPVAQTDPVDAAPEPAASRRTRENTKQATVIQMLRRAEGATVRQICEATGWQSHTVRGTFAGAFKKKLGLAIVSDKAEGGERVYRIA